MVGPGRKSIKLFKIIPEPDLQNVSRKRKIVKPGIEVLIITLAYYHIGFRNFVISLKNQCINYGSLETIAGIFLPEET